MAHRTYTRAAILQHLRQTPTAPRVAPPTPDVVDPAPPLADRIAAAVTRVRALPRPAGLPVATALDAALPPYGATLESGGLLRLSGLVRDLATCHRMAGRFDDEAKCDRVVDILLTLDKLT